MENLVFAYIRLSDMKPLPTIRFATEQDAEALAAIYMPFVENTAVSFEEMAPSASEMWNRVQESMKMHCWLVAKENDAVLGYAYSGPMRTRSAYRFAAEASVYVHHNHYRRSIAAALYLALHDILKLQGYRVCYAAMTIPNAASRGFHLGFGYKSLTAFENIGFKNGSWHSTEWFVKELQEPMPNPPAIKPVSSLPNGELSELLKRAENLIRPS